MDTQAAYQQQQQQYNPPPGPMAPLGMGGAPYNFKQFAPKYGGCFKCGGSHFARDCQQWLPGYNLGNEFCCYGIGLDWGGGIVVLTVSINTVRNQKKQERGVAFVDSGASRTLLRNGDWFEGFYGAEVRVKGSGGLCGGEEVRLGKVGENGWGIREAVHFPALPWECILSTYDRTQCGWVVFLGFN